MNSAPAPIADFEIPNRPAPIGPPADPEFTLLEYKKLCDPDPALCPGLRNPTTRIARAVIHFTGHIHDRDGVRQGDVARTIRWNPGETRDDIPAFFARALVTTHNGIRIAGLVPFLEIVGSPMPLHDMLQASLEGILLPPAPKTAKPAVAK
jgi:hypothetical protein